MWLLLHLIGELEAGLGSQVLHLLLERVISSTRSQLLRWWNHAHVDILLVGRLDLLLLLLEELDLLLDCQLFHARRREHAHQRRQLGRASAMGNVQSATRGTWHTSLRRWWLIGVVLHDDGVHVECEFLDGFGAIQMTVLTNQMRA